MGISDLENILPVEEQAPVVDQSGDVPVGSTSEQAVEQVINQAAIDLVVQELSEVELQESIQALEPVEQKETPDELAIKELRAKYAKNK
jgi:hypothetical protein